MKKSLAALVAGAAGLLAAGLVALAAPASATETETEPGPVCATWHMRGATGAYPEVTFGGAPEGSSVANYSAKLVKPTEGTSPGVEFAAKDVELTATTETTVKVGYSLSEDASSASGAVRLFGYQEKNADTLTSAPDWQDTATGGSGTLSFTVAAGKTIGTLGLVYDASNDAKGSVTFTGLTFGDQPFRFTECPEPEESESADPDTSESADPDESSPAPVTSTSSRPVTTSPSLPVTGPSMGVLVGVALLVVVAGTALTLFARRRKVDFKA